MSNELNLQLLDRKISKIDFHITINMQLYSYRPSFLQSLTRNSSLPYLEARWYTSGQQLVFLPYSNPWLSRVLPLLASTGYPCPPVSMLSRLSELDMPTVFIQFLRWIPESTVPSMNLNSRSTSKSL